MGAWGLGWEVWLDGMEITQFTYFQQAASQVLDMPAVEITYGLRAGTPYVSDGALQLKAVVVTSALDSNAGHGH